MTIEGLCSERYFEQIFSLINDTVRPIRRKNYKAYDGVNNLFNLAYTVLSWKVHLALLKAKLEPYLGFLHGIQFSKPSLICDFLELYRSLMDDFVLGYARELQPRDFVLKEESFSSNRKGKRQYLNEGMQKEFFRDVNSYFRTEVDIPRIRVGQRPEIETNKRRSLTAGEIP